MNVTEWLGDHPWSIWLVLSLVLASAEMLTLDLTLLMLAGGALAGALVALALPGLWWLQILVALAVAGAMLGFLRPTLLARVRNAPGYRSSTGRLVGSQALVTSAIGPDGTGAVKVGGDEWTARMVTPDLSAAPGQHVEVYEVDGATLVVYPVHDALPR